VIVRERTSCLCDDNMLMADVQRKMEHEESPIFKYWGKLAIENSCHPLPYHLLDVAAVARTLLESDRILADHMANLLQLPRSDMLRLVSFLTAIHDFGKFATSFQNQAPSQFELLRGVHSKLAYTIHHSNLGLILWRKALSRIFTYSILPDIGWSSANRLMEILLKPSFGHHGIPPSVCPGGSIVLLEDHFMKEDVEAAGDLLQDLSSQFLMDLRVPVTKENQLHYDGAWKKASWLLAGLIVLSDWIASRETSFPHEDPVWSLGAYWEKIALPRAESAIKVLGLITCSPSCVTGIRNLFPSIENPTPLQSAIEDLTGDGRQRLVILEDQTGSGKTEAALVLVSEFLASSAASGLYFGLPTMATANSMYERVRAACRTMFEERTPSTVLAHSASRASIRFLNSTPDADHEDGDAASWFADNRKKALLAQVGVGTLDQALLGILPLRHQSLRLLGLSKNVLVADEVHAYDPYSSELLCNLLSFQAAMGGSAVLLSATLPRRLRNRFLKAFAEASGWPVQEVESKAFPLITVLTGTGLNERNVTHSAGSRRLHIRMIESEDEARLHVINESRQGRACCWIRNTVAEALAAYAKISTEVDSEQAILFHSRFMMGDRLDIEKEIKQRFGKTSTATDRCGGILVATQVVEQSLDLDFDEMVTDLAPMDLIIQRAGRLRRHTRTLTGDPSERDGRGEPELVILSPNPAISPDREWYARSFPGARYVYPDTARLWLTAEILSSKGVIEFPQDLRSLIEYVFDEDADTRLPESLKEVFFKCEGDSRGGASMGKLNGLTLKSGYDIEAGAWLGKEAQLTTRLGSASSDLVLCREAVDHLVTLFNNEDGYLSTVSIGHHLTGGAITGIDSYDQLLRASSPGLRSLARHRIPVVMSENDGGFHAEVNNEQGKTVKLTYSRKRGLECSR